MASVHFHKNGNSVSKTQVLHQTEISILSQLHTTTSQKEQLVTTVIHHFANANQPLVWIMKEIKSTADHPDQW